MVLCRSTGQLICSTKADQSSHQFFWDTAFQFHSCNSSGMLVPRRSSNFKRAFFDSCHLHIIPHARFFTQNNLISLCIFQMQLSKLCLLMQQGTELHFKSPTAERRHVLCFKFGVGGDRTHAGPLRKSRVCPPEPLGYEGACFVSASRWIINPVINLTSSDDGFPLA